MNFSPMAIVATLMILSEASGSRAEESEATGEGQISTEYKVSTK